MKMETINAAMIQHARMIAEEICATAVMIYVDVIKSRDKLVSLLKESHCILAARDPEVMEELSDLGECDDRIIPVPYMNLSRNSQIKVAAILALSKGIINNNDRLVCLSGSLKHGILDSLLILDVGREFEMFSAHELGFTRQIEKPHVFDRMLTLALELAEEGKEGKPIGTIFVLGDHEKVMEFSSQMIINPFGGVPENQRNILDPGLKETIREFSAIDGAYIIREDGTILAAGRDLKAFVDNLDFPQGLGARHRAAAGITAITKAIAVAISESTGDVRVFSQGRIFMEIEKARKGAF